MKVSVIVPMFNVENYVEQCLDSLSRQTLRDMEVILVDDGCTDNTPLIADKYVTKYPERFRMVHKKNGGLSDARNYGIPYAKGQYLAFLDSDDWVEPPLYEKLSVQMDQGCDVCLTDIEYYFEDPSKRYVMKGLSSWPAETMQKKALLSPMFAWNKMYKAEFFRRDGWRYPLHTWYEDTPVSAPVLATAKNIGYLPECLIHYRQREGSIMADTSSPRLVEIFGVMMMLRTAFHRLGLYEQYYDELEYLHVEHLRLYGMFRFLRSSQWRYYYERSEDTMRNNFPNWRRNRYLRNLNAKNRLFLNCFNPGTARLFQAVIR